MRKDSLNSLPNPTHMSQPRPVSPRLQRCELPYLCWEPQMDRQELALPPWSHCAAHKATSVPNPHVTHTPSPCWLDHHRLCCLFCPYEMLLASRQAQRKGWMYPHSVPELLLKVMEKWAFPFQSEFQALIPSPGVSQFSKAFTASLVGKDL